MQPHWLREAERNGLGNTNVIVASVSDLVTDVVTGLREAGLEGVFDDARRALDARPEWAITSETRAEIARLSASAQKVGPFEAEEASADIEDLSFVVGRLAGLLIEPHPGLFNWQIALGRQLRTLFELTGVPS